MLRDATAQHLGRIHDSAGVPKPCEGRVGYVAPGGKLEPNSGDTNCHLDRVTAKVTVVPVPGVSIVGIATEAPEKSPRSHWLRESAEGTWPFDKLGWLEVFTPESGNADPADLPEAHPRMGTATLVACTEPL